MFKVGDEVICIDVSLHADQMLEPWHLDGYVGNLSLISEGSPYIIEGFDRKDGLFLVGIMTPHRQRYGLGFKASRFRKTQRHGSGLAIESFMTMPGGYEEPRRKVPAKKERA